MSQPEFMKSKEKEIHNKEVKLSVSDQMSYGPYMISLSLMNGEAISGHN